MFAFGGMQGWFKDISSEELKLGKSFEDGEAGGNYFMCETYPEAQT